MQLILKALFKSIKLAGFLLYVFGQIVIANLKVAREVMALRSHANPGIIAVPLDCKSPVEITWLANIISLTPGTLILDISPDHKFLFIHAMFIEDLAALKKSLKESYEKPIMDLFS